MYYIGSHVGRENDGYICGSIKMRRAFKKRREDFKRRVLQRVYGDIIELRVAEAYWLKMIKEEELGIRYYNFKKVATGFDSAVSRKAHAIKTTDGKSVAAVKGAINSHRKKTADGKSIRAVKQGQIMARFMHEKRPEHIAKLNKELHAAKDIDGKSIFAKYIQELARVKKDERGKCMNSVKGGRAGAATLHSAKDELGKSIMAVKAGKASGLARRRRAAELKP